MVLPWKAASPGAWLLDCRLRRYLDEGERFHWQDLLQLTEMAVAAAVSEAYLALLPAFGWVSGSACSFAPWVSRGLVFFAAPFSYLLMYVFVCGSIHFYTQRREQISIQKKPMTDLETRRAIVFSIKSISSISAVSAFAYYVIQGWTNIHWGRPRLQEIPYLLIAYILVDISAYLVHRMLHRPWWYRHVHKAHHLWKSPNVFVVSALHPAELLSLTVPTLAVLTAMPVSIVFVVATLAWIFVCNTIDHSGFELDRLPLLALLFWQAPVAFHDNHHKFFHANYGAMVDWWDRLGGTYYNPEQHGNIGLSEEEFRGTKLLTQKKN
ncbi:unnamed protein product [Effrenium voratum]|nr:unnamed protein product [Effrenium voratum]